MSTTFKNWTVGKKGLLQSTRNVHFDNEGVLTLSPKAVKIYSTTDDANFDVLVSACYLASTYVLVTKDGIFTIDSALAVTQRTASAPTTDTNSDAVVWQNRVYISATDNLSYWSGSAFTNSLEATTSGKSHPLCVMENKNTLLIGNGNSIIQVDTSHVQVSGAQLTLPLNYQVSSIRWSGNNAYIGTISVDGSSAKMFIWNGAGTEAQSGWDVNASDIFSVVVYKSSVVCVTSVGQILRFNGGGFDELANFPVFYSDKVWAATSGSKRVFNRGMKADGDVLHININGMVSDYLGTIVGATTYANRFNLPDQPSGIWTYDPKVGLYHRSLSTLDGYSSIAVSSVASNTLTLASDTKLTTGEPVFIKTLSTLTGIVASKTYYAIVDNPFSNLLKLASTPTLAKAGTAITLGGSAGSAVVWVLNYASIGEITPLASTRAGIVETISPLFQIPSIFNSNLLWSQGMHNVTEMTVLNVGSQGSNVGSFTTNKFTSPNIQENYQQLTVKFKNLILDTEKILIKRKIKDKGNFPTILVDGTYSTNKIISSSALGIESAEIDDEVIITTEYGAGHSRNITTIASPLYTLDEAVPVVSASQELLFYLDNFKKIFTIDNTIPNTAEGYAEVPIAESSKFLQIKADIRGMGTEIEELQLNNEKQK